VDDHQQNGIVITPNSDATLGGVGRSSTELAIAAPRSKPDDRMKGER